MTVTIRRRELLAALGGAAAAWSLAARAQPSRTPTVRFLGELCLSRPPLSRLAQDEKPECAGREAGS